MIIGKRKRWQWTFHVLFWPRRIPWNLWERDKARCGLFILSVLLAPIYLSCHLWSWIGFWLTSFTATGWQTVENWISKAISPFFIRTHSSSHAESPQRFFALAKKKNSTFGPERNRFKREKSFACLLFISSFWLVLPHRCFWIAVCFLAVNCLCGTCGFPKQKILECQIQHHCIDSWLRTVNMISQQLERWWFVIFLLSAPPWEWGEMGPSPSLSYWETPKQYKEDWWRTRMWKARSWGELQRILSNIKRNFPFTQPPQLLYEQQLFLVRWQRCNWENVRGAEMQFPAKRFTINYQQSSQNVFVHFQKVYTPLLLTMLLWDFHHL